MNSAIVTPKAPAALGPYSQGVVAGALVFVSGQIPLDPASGQLVAGGIAEQTHQVMRNAGAVLAQTGLEFVDVAKVTVYLADLGDFAEFNAAYGGYFGQVPPARATVQVARLPLDARVEIEMIATRRGAQA